MQNIVDQIKQLLLEDEEFYRSADNVGAAIKSKYARQILDEIAEIEKNNK